MYSSFYCSESIFSKFQAIKKKLPCKSRTDISPKDDLVKSRDLGFTGILFVGIGEISRKPDTLARVQEWDSEGCSLLRSFPGPRKAINNLLWPIYPKSLYRVIQPECLYSGRNMRENQTI
jgi:hypothetical protein